MPSRVNRRCRMIGRTTNQHMSPTPMGIDTAWKKTIATFMNVGGSVGPVGTRSKNGPVAHLINTYAMKARITVPRPAHHFTGTNRCGSCATAFGGEATPVERELWVAVAGVVAMGHLCIV